jgi:alpha-amylase
LPFLEVFEQYSDIRLSLHTSGPLMEWLDERHPEYVDRLATLVNSKRLEILGGPFYEPILTMIPPRDCVGRFRH